MWREDGSRSRGSRRGRDRGPFVAPAAYATADVTINSFTYDPTDSTGQSLILRPLTAGRRQADEFGLQLAPGLHDQQRGR